MDRLENPKTIVVVRKGEINMPLISAKCTNCGANLEVDNTKEAAICSYCGSAYVVEKAVNYYNTTNNITANVVNVYGGNSADFVIRAGELVKYNGASTKVYIPNTVRIIGSQAFYGCGGLESVVIPDSVTLIQGSAFEFCSSLKEITIPNSITVIGDCAFAYCDNLTEIMLPDSIVTLGARAFYKCLSLKKVVLSHKLEVIGGEAFANCTMLNDVLLGQNIKVIGGGAFYSCTALKEIVIPKSVEDIAGDSDYSQGAFYNCSSLRKVVFKGDTIVHSEAFRSCPIETVDASERWKKENYWLFECLSSYAPQAPRTQSSNGCYIATAVYGSYDCPQVWTLRRFRDNTLAASWYGRAFIRLYYAVSPTLVKLFGHTNWFKKLWCRRLDNVVEKLQQRGVESSPYCDREW